MKVLSNRTVLLIPAYDFVRSGNPLNSLCLEIFVLLGLIKFLNE